MAYFKLGKAEHGIVPDIKQTPNPSPQATRDDISPKSHRVHSILFKTSLKPKVCDTWQMTAPGGHGARRKSIIFTWFWLLFCNNHSKNGLHKKTGITPMKHIKGKRHENSSYLLYCFWWTCNILGLALTLNPWHNHLYKYNGIRTSKQHFHFTFPNVIYLCFFPCSTRNNTVSWKYFPAPRFSMRNKQYNLNTACSPEDWNHFPVSEF